MQNHSVRSFGPGSSLGPTGLLGESVKNTLLILGGLPAGPSWGSYVVASASRRNGLTVLRRLDRSTPPGPIVDWNV